MVGFVANIEKPNFLISFVIRNFVSLYKIDLHKAKKQKFKSLNKMFTRALKKDFVSIDKKSFIHPAQGRLVSFGKIKKGQTYLIKGKNYSLKELIGEENLEDSDSFYFYNYYLSPQDYHRVHHPVSGKLLFTKEIKGPLYPVAPWFVKCVPSVFAKNYRTVSLVKSIDFGDVYTVMVGALNVGSIKMKEGLFLRTQTEKTVSVKSGDELGVFEMGSSVVIVTQQKLDVKEGRVFFERLL